MIVPQFMEPVSVFIALLVWRVIGIVLEIYAIYDLLFARHF